MELRLPENEVGMACAAVEAGTAICLSTLATARRSEVAAPRRGWFQLGCFRGAGLTRALAEEAVACGFEAIVVTVDAPPAGKRERDRREHLRTAPPGSLYSRS